jgi:predicted membrane channel-forming protein YqfA (hemolysin III family)
MSDDVTAQERHGAGGTEGGVLTFFVGVGMAAAGAYLLTSRVMVQTNVWRMWGFNGFGLSLIPLLLGIGMLFYDGRSLLAKLLTFVGVVIIFAGILMNLEIYFQQTPLFATLMMMVLLAGGVGLVLRAVRPMRRG